MFEAYSELRKLIPQERGNPNIPEGVNREELIKSIDRLISEAVKYGRWIEQFEQEENSNV